MGGLTKSRSCTSLNEQGNGGHQGYDNYLTVHGNVSSYIQLTMIQ